ncbi:MAG: IspD/TarI family cytidylyltransferase [Bacillota bacterium]|nr:IspD/TarI family cytidylyltransferase [Bacillota bacterium]
MGKNIAVIFAGGSGVRMGSGTPKQFLEVNGKPIVIHTLDIFEEHPLIDEIYIACKEDCINKLNKYIERFWIKKVKKVVPGGSTALGSIYNGLKAAKESNNEDDIVLIHDGVRPCITSELIDDVINTVKTHGSAVTCTALFETPVLSHSGEYVEDIPSRDDFYTAQAPQCFFLGEVYEAYNKVRRDNPEYKGMVDTCSLMRSTGKQISIVKGNRGNIKVTTPEDLYIFRAMMQYRETQDAFGLTQKETPSKFIK